ncbi:MAG TPA: hypothetical protein VKE98_15175 [Gemmataceae bacterium]|nr:hypothetical protein [Gemmataceae bacterium]
MPDKETKERAEKDRREGKSPTTQAGEFVREEFHHIREGKHGARSPQQAIAIGLSKARRAGVPLRPPKAGRVSERTRQSATRAYRAGQKRSRRKPSRTRSRAITRALRREGTHAASHAAIGRQTRRVARQRSAGERRQIARKAARSRTPAQRSASARKAARTRARHSA